MNGLRVLQSSEVENPTSKFMRIFMSGKKRLNPQKRKKKRYYERYLSLRQREGNGTVAGFGKVVNGRAKDLRSMLTKFWRRKQPSIRRVSALLCLCHTQLKLLYYSQWEAKRKTAKRCPTSKSAARREIWKAHDFEVVTKVSDWWLYFHFRNSNTASL